MTSKNSHQNTFQDAMHASEKAGMSRRNFLKGTAAAFAYFAGLESTIASTHDASPVHIAIVGSGSAGISIANRLAEALPNAKLTIIDRKEPHVYWPGLTLVGTGVWEKDKVLPGSNASFLPKGERIQFIQEMATSFDPENKKLTTDSGQTLQYDFLVVTTGLEYDYGFIEGLDESRIGENGIASVYHSPEKAAASWNAIEKFSKEGGNGFFTIPHTPIRCAGAPLKTAFLTMDQMKRNGGFANANINFFSSTSGVFGLPWFNDFVIKRFEENGFNMEYQTRLTAVDMDAKTATFTGQLGEDTYDYDLLHIVPPMRAPKAIRESALAWQEGSFATGGWLDVDKETLQHRRYPEIFGCGDVNGTPLGKTAATVKMSVPIVVNNLLSVIQGQASAAKFNGYTSCPLITEIGSAMLIEFDYNKELIPTYSFIDPQQESWFAWVMKEQMLKPTYLRMLAGKV